MDRPALLSRFGAGVLACAMLAGCDGAAEDAVSNRMADPEAVQFRDLRKCSEDNTVTQGRFNAKNAYGAYTGFEPFYYATDVGAVILGDSEFSAMTSRCYGRFAEAADAEME